MNEFILKCVDVTKSYGGLVALDRVSFEVSAHEVFGVIGPNGAGKTTLFDVISGVSTADTGSMNFRGREIGRLGAADIAQSGLLRTFQTPVTFPDLTVRENILVGAYFGGNRESADNPAFRSEKINQVLDFCGLGNVSSQIAGQMPILARKQLMIATALVADPKLLMLDEPIGGLNRQEQGLIIGLLKDLNAAGITLLIIEHVMSALLAIANRLLILDYGKVIFDGIAADAINDENVLQAYLGTEAEAFRT